MTFLTLQSVQPEVLPQYRSHKVVRAARITGIETAPAVVDKPEEKRLILGDLLADKDMTAYVLVTTEWVEQRKAEAGGWFVVYEDGYTSYSPDKAFTEGYTAISSEPLDGCSLQALSAATAEIAVANAVVVEASRRGEPPTIQAGSLAD